MGKHFVLLLSLKTAKWTWQFSCSEEKEKIKGKTTPTKYARGGVIWLYRVYIYIYFPQK